MLVKTEKVRVNSSLLYQPKDMSYYEKMGSDMFIDKVKKENENRRKQEKEMER